MDLGPHTVTDGKERVVGTDILQLAQDFGIDPDALETVLAGAAAVMRVSRENVHPANKKALRGLVEALTGTIDRVSELTARERLVEAAVERPQGADEEGIEAYAAWWTARERVDRAIEGAKELLAVVRAAELLKLEPGRPRYTDWEAGIDSLISFWTYALNREVTISGHADDGGGYKPSPTVRFVYQCMQLLGENITEQACRTVLQTLRRQIV